MKYSNILVPILAATVACAITRYYWPRIDTKIVTSTQVVEKKHTITRIVEPPNGPKVTYIDSISTEASSSNSTTTTYKSPQWRVGLLAGFGTVVSKSETSPAIYLPEYGLEVQKRLAGPLFVGVSFVHDVVAAQIGLEF